MARPTSPTLLPDASCLHLVRLETDGSPLELWLRRLPQRHFCPLCQCRSESVHSGYVRLVADLPWAGWAVRLELHVRRFFCLNKECVRQIFTERLPSVVAPYARHTRRLGDLHTDRLCSRRGSGQALGGWNGVRDQSRYPPTTCAWTTRKPSIHASRAGRGRLLFLPEA